MPPRLAYGVSAGVAVQSDSRSHFMSRVGPLASAHGMWRASSRFGGLLQLSVAHFTPNTDAIYGVCPKPGGSAGCNARIPERALTLAGATGSLVLFDDSKARTGRGAHYALGLAVYRELHAPNGVHRTRTGWSAGIGYDVRVVGVNATLDARLEQIPHWTQRNWHIVPMAVGITW